MRKKWKAEQRQPLSALKVLSFERGESGVVFVYLDILYLFC